MVEIRFASKEHKEFFISMMEKSPKNDSYHRAFFYCVGISVTTRTNINRLYSLKEDRIEPDALHDGWQTSGSMRITRLAFNLWNGYVEKDKEEMSTPYELFDSGYAPYMFEAIRMKYPEYCRELPSSKLQINGKER